jgi:hypothetical protein
MPSKKSSHKTPLERLQKRINREKDFRDRLHKYIKDPHKAGDILELWLDNEHRITQLKAIRDEYESTVRQLEVQEISRHLTEMMNEDDEFAQMTKDQYELYMSKQEEEVNKYINSEEEEEEGDFDLLGKQQNGKHIPTNNSGDIDLQK